jgi:hypothetical protein
MRALIGFLSLLWIHKFLNHGKSDRYLVSMDLLRQILTVLFLPLAIFFFMIGWGLQWIGQKQSENRVGKPHRETVVNDGATDVFVEVKVIEALMEEVLKAE